MENLTTGELIELYEKLVLGESTVKKLIDKDDNGIELTDDEMLFLSEYAKDALELLFELRISDEEALGEFGKLAELKEKFIGTLQGV